MAVIVQLGDPGIEQPQPLEHGLLELRRLEVPGPDPGDVLERLLLIHQLGLVCQLPQRPGDEDGGNPDEQQDQQVDGNDLEQHPHHLLIQPGQGGGAGTLRHHSPVGLADGGKAGQHLGACLIGQLERPLFAVQHPIDHPVVTDFFTDPGTVRVIDAGSVAIDHIEGGAILVVVLAQHAGEQIG